MSRPIGRMHTIVTATNAVITFTMDTTCVAIGIPTTNASNTANTFTHCREREYKMYKSQMFPRFRVVGCQILF